MKQYQKKYYGLYNPCKRVKENGYKIKRCECCGKMIKKTNKKDYSTKYCDECAIIKKKESNRISDLKYKKKKREKLKSEFSAQPRRL